MVSISDKCANRYYWYILNIYVLWPYLHRSIGVISYNITDYEFWIINKNDVFLDLLNDLVFVLFLDLFIDLEFDLVICWQVVPCPFKFDSHGGPSHVEAGFEWPGYATFLFVGENYYNKIVKHPTVGQNKGRLARALA